jgi:hypothetical protein
MVPITMFLMPMFPMRVEVRYSFIEIELYCISGLTNYRRQPYRYNTLTTNPQIQLRLTTFATASKATTPIWPYTTS